MVARWDWNSLQVSGGTAEDERRQLDLLFSDSQVERLAASKALICDDAPYVVEYLGSVMKSLDGEIRWCCIAAFEESEEVLRDGHLS